MEREKAEYASALLQQFKRTEEIYDNIAMLKEDGGKVTIDFDGKSTGRVIVIDHTETKLLTAIQNGLQELI